MLGEMIGEDKGRITGHRVIPAEGGKKRVEVSMTTNGKMLGVDFKEFGTYWSELMDGGYLYGEGQGVLMTTTGDSAAWVGQGVGRFKQGGGLSWRGTIYFETASQKLARLNGACVLFEHESDADDNVTSKYWEWK